MKKQAFALLIGIFLVILTAGIARAEIREFGQIVAVVNQEAITNHQLDQEVITYLAARNIMSPTNDQVAEAKEEVLDYLVSDLMLYQEAKRRGVLVTPDEINAEANRRLEQLKAQFPSEQEFIRALAQQFTTEERLMETFRHQAEVTLYKQRLVNAEVRPDIVVTDEEITEEYLRRGEQLQVRQIVLATRSRAEDIRRQLVEGGDFAALARRYSVAPSASQGGDLGLFGRGQMSPEFDAVAFSLEINDISPIMETELGYSIIQITRRVRVELPPMSEETRNRIYNDLFLQKLNAGIEEFVDQLKLTAYIEIRES